MQNQPQVTLDEALKLAQQYHQSGNLTLADQTYRDILNVLPDNFTSLHYLGIIAFQRNNLQEGLKFIEKATEVKDESAPTWNAYAVMLAQTGKIEEAIDKWQKALTLQPDFPDVLSNMGNALWKLERHEESREACQKAIDLKPDFADAYINLGNAYTGLGDAEKAIEIWEKAIELNPQNCNGFINIGNALRDLGRIQESEEYCRKALELAPEHPDALSNLANALKDQGQLEEAEKYYRKSTEMRPNHPSTHNNLAILMMEMLKYDEAITSARYAIAFDPQSADAYGNLSIALRETGKLKEAEEAARQSLTFAPESAESRIDLADILFLMDRFDEAEALLNEAMELTPDSPRLYVKLSAVLERANKMEKAIEAIKQAEELNPEMPEVFHRQSLIYLMANKLDEALEASDKALKLNSKIAAVLSTRSEIYQALGDMKAAEKAARDAIDANQKIPFAYLTLSKTKKFTAGDADVVQMEKLAENNKVFGNEQTASLYFALFKAYEDIKDYDKSFEYLKKANDTKYALVSAKDLGAEVFQTVKNQNSKDHLEQFKGKGSQDDTPIFILGMPRSGTTLTEQIISSHPDVFGAGELHALTEVQQKNDLLNPDNCELLGDEYVKLVRAISKESAKARKITDKMPANYIHMGQIFATLPNAKIIHCQRNPIDTCLSCYKQLFARGHYWSYNLEKMAEHYALYEDMMQHWRDVLPADSFLEISYEDTVNDFENQARRLLDFVEMEWDDACLTPHKTKRAVLTASKGQVRKPVYKTSVEAWKRYEEPLAPLAEALAPFVKK